MRRLLALCMLMTFAAPARAHFIWLVPDAGGKGDTLRMVFSDTLGPDEAVPITKVAQTKLFARAGTKGEEVPVGMAPEKHACRVTVKAEGTVAVAGVCQYGVLSKGKGEPFLLMYYPRGLLQRAGAKGRGPWLYEPTPGLPLEIVPSPRHPEYRVLWGGKPAPGVEVTLLVPGVEDPVEDKTDEQGRVFLAAPKATGPYGIRAKFVEKRAGELDGKKYAEVRHYATLTMLVGTGGGPKGEKNVLAPPKTEVGRSSQGEAERALLAGKAPSEKPAPDAAATKLLADARAARAVWRDFPGFRADVEVNDNGTAAKGKLEVSAQGKVSLQLDGASDATKAWARRELASLVAHRLPGGPSDTPCAFADDAKDHPQGRLIRILNDELHSVYRIRGREIIEVHRQMKDVRFTISVLENVWNAEKQCLPAHYVVNSWDLKKEALQSSIAHQNAWRRVGGYDLPASLLVVHATPARLESRRITFANVQLNGAASAER